MSVTSFSVLRKLPQNNDRVPDLESVITLHIANRIVSSYSMIPVPG